MSAEQIVPCREASRLFKSKFMRTPHDTRHSDRCRRIGKMAELIQHRVDWQTSTANEVHLAPIKASDDRIASVQ